MDRSRFRAVAYSATALFNTESLLQSRKTHTYIENIKF